MREMEAAAFKSGAASEEAVCQPKTAKIRMVDQDPIIEPDFPLYCRVDEDVCKTTRLRRRGYGADPDLGLAAEDMPSSSGSQDVSDAITARARSRRQANKGQC